ncbi:ATP-binding cassette domain-containing protein [Velocimicrobium porci]|uniref:ABC transporter ATP-binding protein n=1 Tax=Velocimicrobium porci TaxID=2606634 RepID=A0A6L5XW13_9FIRM|nr:ATP-binding cassette domain-containing protein [Velocimicrobium porci]MSS62784.1 ABC transporter ATP-binding protein [Velocimicrobium porci]
MERSLYIEHLYKSYHNQPVLTDLCCQIPQGKVTAITAPSGSGKTTLIRILLGLEEPDYGVLNGFKNLKKSAVFQEDRLCENLTALANIRLTSISQNKSYLISAMEQIGLYDCWQKPVHELSGGMKRRIAILRALLADYDLLILDEPFKGLDPATKEIVIKDTKKRSMGKTILFVTHDELELSLMNPSQILTL